MIYTTTRTAPFFEESLDVLKYNRKRLWRLCYVTCTSIKLIETVTVNGTGLELPHLGMVTCPVIINWKSPYSTLGALKRSFPFVLHLFSIINARMQTVNLHSDLALLCFRCP